MEGNSIRQAFTEIYNRAYEAILISMDAKSELEKLQAQNERLREALENFANDGHWDVNQSNICEMLKDYIWYQDMVSPIDIARRALGEEADA